MAPFLATRRLARADDLVTPLRLVVAAAVVATLAPTGALAVDDWTDSESADRGGRAHLGRRGRWGPGGGGADRATSTRAAST